MSMAKCFDFGWGSTPGSKPVTEVPAGGSGSSSNDFTTSTGNGNGNGVGNGGKPFPGNGKPGHHVNGRWN